MHNTPEAGFAQQWNKLEGENPVPNAASDTTNN